MVNVHIQTLERTEQGLVEGNWIETFNLNSAEYDEFDPLLRYTYYPCDSMNAVVDAPFFGIFPLSAYYTKTNDGKLLSEESFYNESLLGIPGGLVYSLGASHNNFDEDGLLTSYVVDWEGLDSTQFYYNAFGKVDHSVQMNALFKTDPEEYVLTQYYYDSLKRLSAVVTTYFIDSLMTADFKDSLAYVYGEDRDYRTESFFLDDFVQGYTTGDIIEYSFIGDTVEVVDIITTGALGTFVSERTRSVYDEEGRFVSTLVQKAFTPNNPLTNSTLVVRKYEGSTVATEDIVDNGVEKLVWYRNGDTLNANWDEPCNGRLCLYAPDGREVVSAVVNGTEGQMYIPHVLDGVYYLGLIGNGGIVGSATTYLNK